jgi:uncharacterized metal-binding protein YceD (DUF177 family)
MIPFRGLKPGKHGFDVEVGKKFFETFEDAEIHNGNVKVHIDLEKEERMMVFQFSFQGEVELPCDRCNEPIMVPVSGNERLIVKLGDSWEEQSEEVLVIPETEIRFDTAPLLYEFIHLALPLRHVHPDDEKGQSTCDPEVMKRLSEIQVNENTDPRWDALLKLKKEKKRE